MRWEDERYVKVYTRETMTTLRLEWQGRAVLAELFKKVDRAGLLEIGEEDPVASLAVLLRMPEEVVRIGWEKLTVGKDPVVTIRDGKSRAIFIPNFLPAQEANQTDRARKEKSRELAHAKAVLQLGPAEVTPRDDKSQSVTESHVRSHAVTPRVDETRLEEPNSPPPPAAAAPRERVQESAPPLLAGKPADPWPEAMLERLRAAFRLTGMDAVRNTAKADAFERMRVTSLKFPLAQRLSAAEAFLEDGRGEKEGPAYLVTMVENGAVPRSARAPPERPPRGAPFNPRIDPNAHTVPGRKKI